MPKDVDRREMSVGSSRAILTTVLGSDPPLVDRHSLTYVSSLSPSHETLSQDSDAFHLGYGCAQGGLYDGSVHRVRLGWSSPLMWCAHANEKCLSCPRLLHSVPSRFSLPWLVSPLLASRCGPHASDLARLLSTLGSATACANNLAFSLASRICQT